jgi:hypothetical protein
MVGRRIQFRQLQQAQTCPTQRTAKTAAWVLFADDAFDEPKAEGFIAFKFQAEEFPSGGDARPTEMSPKEGERMAGLFGDECLHPFEPLFGV